MVVHHYYEIVPKVKNCLKQKMAQLMCKKIDDKRKTFDTHFGKMVCGKSCAWFGISLKKFKSLWFEGEEDVEMTFKKLLVEPSNHGFGWACSKNWMVELMEFKKINQRKLEIL